MADPIKFLTLHTDQKKKNMKKKSFIFISGILLTAMTFMSCSSDDAPPIRLEKPNTTGKAITAVEHSGYLPDTYDWKFNYHDGRLTSGEGTYRKEVESPYTYNFYLDYGSDRLGIRSSGNEESIITLNSDNLIQKMQVNKNTFNFIYASKYLIAWEENIVSESFGQVTSYTSNAIITYDNFGNLKEIAYTENSNYEDDKCTITFTPSDIPNINGLLPEVVSKQMGCLGFEYLYYAGALGKGSSNLVKRAQFNYAKYPEKNFEIEFDYVKDREGNVTYCTYSYKDRPAGVTYRY